MKKILGVRSSNQLWDAYWGAVDIKDNLGYCIGDQVLSAFHHYLRKDQLILEAGCGLAKWVIYLSGEGHNVIGLDTHEASLERVRAAYPQLSLILGSVTELPLAAACLDSYISLGVVEHFEEGPAAALSEAYRVLKPGGIAIIETPCNNTLRRMVINHLQDAVRAAKKRLGYRYQFAEYRFTASELASFVCEAGFSILAILPKDYEQAGKSIGLLMDIPILRRSGGATFDLNALGRIVKRILLALSPWVSSACVVCVAQKGEE